METTATIQWSGYLWVAVFNGTRYADSNDNRLTERLYNAGASIVFEDGPTLDDTSRIGKILSRIKKGVFRKCAM